MAVETSHPPPTSTKTGNQHKIRQPPHQEKRNRKKTVHFRWAIRSDKRLVKYDGVILNKSLGKQKNCNNNIKYTKCLVGTSEKKREGQDWLRWNLWTNTCSPPTDTNTRSLRVDSLEFAFNRVYKWENFVYVKNDLPTRQVSYSRHAKHSFPNKKREGKIFILDDKKKTDWEYEISYSTINIYSIFQVWRLIWSVFYVYSYSWCHVVRQFWLIGAYTCVKRKWRLRHFLITHVIPRGEDFCFLFTSF